MFYSNNKSYHWKLNQSEVAISGRLANQKPGKKTNQKGGYRKKQPIDFFFFFFLKKNSF